jgi:general secretion pathway protein A
LYQGFYNLKENPFRLSPDPAFLYMTPQHREALAGLVYSIADHTGGLAVLAGEAGTGKTTLLYSLLSLLERHRFITALINNPTMSRAEFYEFVLAKLGIECSSSMKSQQLLALEDSLQRNRAMGRLSVLILDEAQRLPSELLEEVRLLLNMETPREKLLTILIAGQPELLETLRRPELRQLKQRVNCLCKLEPLSLEELREYVNHRLQCAGMPSQTLFSNEHLALIHQYSRGIPRLINSLCDSAMQTAFAMQSRTIDKSIVLEAAKDLDLVGETVLPLPVPIIPASDPTNGVPPPFKSNGHEGTNGFNGTGARVDRVPFEAHATQGKGTGFFASLWGRWR